MVVARYSRSRSAVIIGKITPAVAGFLVVCIGMAYLGEGYVEKYPSRIFVLLVALVAGIAIVAMSVRIVMRALYGVINDGAPFIVVENDALIIRGPFGKLFSSNDLAEVGADNLDGTAFDDALRIICKNGTTLRFCSDMADIAPTTICKIIGQHLTLPSDVRR